jgi:hypothetical protein
VVQTAVKIVLEPIYEADFLPWAGGSGGSSLSSRAI